MDRIELMQKNKVSLSIEEKRKIVAIGPDELCTQKMLFVECEVVSSSSSSGVAEAHLVQVPAIPAGPQVPGADHGQVTAAGHMSGG